MTQHERLVISAYTGVLMTDFSELHKYIEALIGRPVWTHELASRLVQDEIQKRVKPEFLALCGNN